MSKVINSIRFHKYDQYGNSIMIASGSMDSEQENYENLKELAQKLDDKDFGTYLPIFNSTQYNYSTIRFKKDNKTTKLIPRAKYDITYKIKTIMRDSKIYVNCFVTKIRMVEKPPVIDEGELLKI